MTLCSTPSSLFLASSVLFLQLYLHHTSRLWQCGCIVFIDSTTQTLFDVFWHVKSTFNWLYVLLPAASSSRLLCSSSNCAYIMRQDCGNVDVMSSLIQPPRLSSLFFGMKSQHSTDSMFYSKQPLPRVFCALPPIVPTSCVKTLAMWMYCLYWFNHPDSLRCFLAWKVNIQLTLCSTPSSLFLASSVLFLQSCLHHASRLWQCGCIVFVDSTTQTLFAVFWQANIQLTLCSTPSSLFLASSVLFLQFCLVVCQDCCNLDVLSLLIQPPRLSSLFFDMKSQHSTDSMFYSKQPLPRVFCALPPIVPTSCVKTVAMWMYCLYWFNHPDSLRCFLACKVNIQLTLCSTPSSLFLASSVLFLQSCLHHASRLWQCGCIVFIDSINQTLFAVFWQANIQLTLCSTLAASSSRLLCSSSSFAYMACQDWQYMDVMSPLVQSKHCSQLLSLKINIQLIHWLCVLL